jgi:hypothetical protein
VSQLCGTELDGLTLAQLEDLERLQVLMHAAVLATKRPPPIPPLALNWLAAWRPSATPRAARQCSHACAGTDGVAVAFAVRGDAARVGCEVCAVAHGVC